MLFGLRPGSSFWAIGNDCFPICPLLTIAALHLPVFVPVKRVRSTEREASPGERQGHSSCTAPDKGFASNHPIHRLARNAIMAEHEQLSQPEPVEEPGKPELPEEPRNPRSYPLVPLKNTVVFPR